MSAGIKSGVAIHGLRPEVVLALLIVTPILGTYEQEMVITSALDGKHKRSSAHYTGRAVDLRIWTLTDQKQCVADMQKALGTDYDVVLEENHIHLEFDPKKGANSCG